MMVLIFSYEEVVVVVVVIYFCDLVLQVNSGANQALCHVDDEGINLSRAWINLLLVSSVL